MKSSHLAHMGLTLVLAAGCSSAASDRENDDTNQTESISLALVDSKGSLTMDGCPADRAYRPSYPNPDRISQMDVSIGANGKIASSCRSGSQGVSCKGTPFFTKATPSDRGTTVFVWDVFGRTIAERSFAPGQTGNAQYSSTGTAGSQQDRSLSSDQTGGTSGTSNAEVDNSRGAAGAAATPPAGGQGTSHDRVDGGNAAPGTATPGAGTADTGASECSQAAVQLKACNDVNARLKAVGLSDQIDCSTAATFEALHQPNFDDDNLIRCDEVIEPLEDGFLTCGNIGEMYYDNALHMLRFQLLSRGVCRTSPLVLDLDGDGIHLSTLQEGTSFDLLGTGEMVSCAWTDGKDAFLSQDRNENGLIDGANELFGNVTAAQSFQNGFAALAQLDANHDGQVDASDPEMSTLLLWVDANRDGRSTSEELVPLSDAGITSLDVRPRLRASAESVDEAGNSIPLVSSFTRRDGSHGALVDAFLRFKPASR